MTSKKGFFLALVQLSAPGTFWPCCFLQCTRVNTVKKFVKSAHAPDCILARLLHVIARAGARVCKKRVIHVKLKY